MAFNIYGLVTNQILDALGKNIIPWRRPWVGLDDEAINFVSRKAYSPLNQMLLGAPGEYLTFTQINEKGGNIKKGAVTKTIYYWKPADYAKKAEMTDADDGTTIIELKHRGPVLRYYRVFHIGDTEGIPSRSKEIVEERPFTPVQDAVRIIDDYTSHNKHILTEVEAGVEPHYDRGTDIITCPDPGQFPLKEEYYGTMFSLMVRSTGHRLRLNRPMPADDKEKAREELICEIGSAMLCNKCGISTEKAFDNSVAYIHKWQTALKEDDRAIVMAASRAAKAVAMILGDKSYDSI